MTTLAYQKILSKEFEKRLSINCHYSMRAFARALNLSPSALSEIIRGKRGLSVKKARGILERLNLAYRDSLNFLESVKSTKAKFKNTVAQADYSQLEEDKFSVIAEWEYFAVLNLIELDDFQANSRWISDRLNIPFHKVTIILERLESLELIEQTQMTIQRVSAPIKCTDDLASLALKSHHRGMINKALEALETVDVNDRDITSITMGIDIEKIPEAKVLIKRFRRGLAELLESGAKDEVYNLNIQLFPISVSKEKQK